jgi:hypothetical protein
VILGGCGGESRPVPFADLTRSVGQLEFTRITRDHFESREALLKVLERHNPRRGIDLPAIDFSRRSVYLVAAGPRSSTGYELRIVAVRDEGDHVVVVVREETPALGDPVAARVTYPFRLISLPRTDEPVKLKWLGRP